MKKAKKDLKSYKTKSISKNKHQKSTDKMLIVTDDFLLETPEPPQIIQR